MGWRALKITVDTNVLIRLFALDDPGQLSLAERLLREAEVIVVPLPVWCEFVWVLGRLRRIRPERLADGIETLLAAPNLVTDLAAVHVGIAMLRAGGDFADGAIAENGAALGGTVFVSFDRGAVALRRAAGGHATTPEDALNP